MRVLLIILLALLFVPVFAQEEKKHIREGNKQYENKDYLGAEQEYRQALEKKKDSFKAMFNLGDAYYKEGKYQEAAGQFEMLTGRKTSRDTLARVYHNLGNALLKQKQYEKSVAAYKNALKNNPDDEDTRYNLAYALKMLQQQQQKQDQQKQQQNQDKKDNKDKKDDKQDQKKDKQDQQKQQQQPQMSKEDAQRLLDALNNDEKDIQKRLKKEKRKGQPTGTDKDW
jgi:Ca-activated chloride channel family protein